LGQHALGIEIRGVERDGVAHDPGISRRAAVKQGQNDIFQFIVQGAYLLSFSN